MRPSGAIPEWHLLEQRKGAGPNLACGCPSLQEALSRLWWMQWCRHAAGRAGHAMSARTIGKGISEVSLRMSAPAIAPHGLALACALGTRLLCNRICA